MTQARGSRASIVARICIAACFTLLGCACFTLLGCSDVTTNLVSDPPDAAHAVSDASTAKDATIASMLDSGSMLADAASPITICGDHTCACSDGNDDDGDMLVDGFDPECTGAFDDDESTFATGTPITSGACRDCFWDDNAGSGDDDCRYPRECLATGNAPNGKGKCGGDGCDVSTTCIDRCLSHTPNGCDCFGCCKVTRPDGTSATVALNDACSLDKLDDTAACPTCVQNPSCTNTCGRCELCPGRTQDMIPADCGALSPTGSPRYVCEEGQSVCAVNSDCDTEYRYCQQGCCLPILF